MLRLTFYHSKAFHYSKPCQAHLCLRLPKTIWNSWLQMQISWRRLTWIGPKKVLDNMSLLEDYPRDIIRKIYDEWEHYSEIPLGEEDAIRLLQFQKKWMQDPNIVQYSTLDFNMVDIGLQRLKQVWKIHLLDLERDFGNTSNEVQKRVYAQKEKMEQMKVEDIIFFFEGLLKDKRVREPRIILDLSKPLSETKYVFSQLNGMIQKYLRENGLPPQRRPTHSKVKVGLNLSPFLFYGPF